MEVTVKAGELAKEAVDAIVLMLYEGEDLPQGIAAKIDQALDGAITALLREGEFAGKSKQQTVLHAHGRLKPKKVVLTGLGKPENLTLDALRQAAGSAARVASALRPNSLATSIDGAERAHLELSEAAQAVTEGMVLGLYRFDKFKTESNDIKDVARLTLIGNNREQTRAIQRGAEIGRILAESTNFARSLVNHPSNEMTPTIL